MSYSFTERSQGRSGFTLIELAIVIGIMGMLLALISPVLFRPRPGEQREKFVDELSRVVADGFLGALESGMLHRVVFDLVAREVRVEQSTGKTDIQGTMKFEPALGSVALVLPDNLQIKNFYVNRHDELVQAAGAETKKIWFYITPGGTGQEVTINMLDMNALDAQGKPAQLSIVLNPFSMQLMTYGTFQKP